jgi:hypothetical protein
MTLQVLVCEACHGTGGKNDDCHKCKGVGRYQELQYSNEERKKISKNIESRFGIKSINPKGKQKRRNKNE